MIESIIEFQYTNNLSFLSKCAVKKDIMCESKTKDYVVLAYYYFTTIEDPHAEVRSHLKFCESRDIKARVYISEEGINGQLSASAEDGQAYMEWMRNHPLFNSVVFKIHYHHEQAFPRLTIKYRKQLVALDAKVDMANTGKHLSPAEWKEKLDRDEGHVLVDLRNDYEWKVGRFDGAELPACATFREFQEYADKLKENVDTKETPVMMYCTGGIRCEVYSAYLKEMGFENVYQLDGGIINYGLKEGSAHWLGKLFVFDDRLTVPISEDPAPVVGVCHACGTQSENYYNCASMDCNELFLCCIDCLKQYSGCCGEKCQLSPRLRPYQDQNPHKPFRKKHHYVQKP